MKKKAFTLIKLLAVIIILAVIALIATPIVLNVVQDAREKARQESIHGYSEAVILTNAKNQLATTQTDLKVGANAKMKGETAFNMLDLIQVLHLASMESMQRIILK